jgi:hypothetical protein
LVGAAGTATPGIERFDYFRHVVRRREGSEPPAVLLGRQDRFDTHFLDSPAWQRPALPIDRTRKPARLGCFVLPVLLPGAET